VPLKLITFPRSVTRSPSRGGADTRGPVGNNRFVSIPNGDTPIPPVVRNPRFISPTHGNDYRFWQIALLLHRAHPQLCIRRNKTNRVSIPSSVRDQIHPAITTTCSPPDHGVDNGCHQLTDSLVPRGSFGLSTHVVRKRSDHYPQHQPALRSPFIYLL
jgi:hypothetical protein